MEKYDFELDALRDECDLKRTNLLAAFNAVTICQEDKAELVKKYIFCLQESLKANNALLNYIESTSKLGSNSY